MVALAKRAAHEYNTQHQHQYTARTTSAVAIIVKTWLLHYNYRNNK